MDDLPRSDPSIFAPQSLAASQPGPPPGVAPDPSIFDPVGHFVGEKARQGADWSDVAGGLKGLDAGKLEGQYKLERARAEEANRGESEVEYLARRSLPVASAVGNWAREKRYQIAVDKFNKGEAGDDDYKVMARHERLQELDRQEQSTTAGAIQSAAFQAPAVIGEAYLTAGLGLAPRAGAGLGTRAAAFAGTKAIQTPLMPSLYLEQGAKAETAGEGTGEAYGKALGYGYLQNLVLGQLQAKVNVPGGLAARTAAKTALGVGEQQAADAIAGATGLHTGYGLAGDFLDSKTPADDAWRHATVQAVTFAAFSGHHEALESWAKAGRAMKAAGVPEDVAAETLSKVHDQVLFAPDPAARKAVVDKLPEGSPVRLFGQHLLDGLDKAEAAGKTVQSPPADFTVRPRPAARIGVGEEAPTEFQAPARPGQRLTFGPPERAPESPQPRPEPEPAQTPAEPPNARPEPSGKEFDVLEDALFRVPDSKRQGGGGNIDALRAEIMNGAAKKWASKGVEANDPHWKGGQFQLVLDPRSLPAEGVRPGAKGDVGVDYPGLADSPALLAVRFKGRPDHADFAEAKDFLDGINRVRIGNGLDPVRLFSDLGEAHPPEPPVTLAPPEPKPEPAPEPNPVTLTGQLPSSPLSPVERMRAAQAKRGGVAPRPGITQTGTELGRRPVGLRPPPAPAPDVPRSPLLDQPDRPTLAGLFALDRSARDAVMASHGLTERERHVLHERIENDRTHGAIGRDEPVRKENGDKLTRARVEQIEKKALGKLGIEESVAAGLHADAAAENALDRVERGERVGGADAAVEFGRAKAESDRRGKLEERALRAQDRIDRLIKLVDKEVADAERDERPVDPAKLADYARRIAGHETVARRAEAAKQQAADGNRQGAKPAGGVAAKPAATGLNRGPVGLGTALRKAGGVSKQSWLAHGLDVAIAEENIKPSPFQDSNGRASKRALDDVIPELVKSGDVVPRENEHPHDTLRRMLERKGTLSADFMASTHGAAHFDRLAAEHERRQQELENDPEYQARLAAEAKRDEVAGSAKEVYGADESFDFGHNVEAAAQKHFADQIEDNLRSDLPEAMGAASRGFTAELRGQLAAQVKAAATRYVNGVRDYFGQLGGRVAPRTNRLSPAAGDAVAGVDTAQTLVRELVPHFLDGVLGRSASVADRLKLGAVLTERRLRHVFHVFMNDATAASQLGVRLKQEAAGMPAETPAERAAKARVLKQMRAAFRSANDSAEKMRGVRSVVGQPLQDKDLVNPLMSEADYQTALKDPAVQRQIAAYDKLVVPELEKHFRLAEGMAEDERIDSRTQVPGSPVPFKAVREAGESPTAVVFGGGPANAMKAHTLRKLGSARGATGGSAYGYDIDFGNIVTKALADRVPLGAEHNLYRVLEKEALGRWSKPGHPVGLLGEPWKRVERVSPPPGTQAAEKGETDFYVHPEVFGEVRQVLDRDRHFEQLPGSSVLTALSVASTVEPTYHVRNQMTQMFRPFMSPAGFARHLYEVATRDPAAMRGVVELARLDALKAEGYETEPLGGKYNPLAKLQQWGQKLITVTDRAVRLTANDAFDAMVKRGLVADTPQNRRDWINQLGNYSKKSQNRLVALARDLGLGPFATAGTTFLMGGLRAATLTHGLKTTSRAADLNLRARYFLRLAALPTLAAAVNYALWGRADGDDKTPILALKVGEKDGKTSYLDLGGLTGLGRGLRELGLTALIEGNREGAKKAGAGPSDIGKKAVTDSSTALLHPFAGPLADFLHEALTGRDIGGVQKAPRANEAKGESQEARNLWTAVAGANPFLDKLLRPWLEEQMGLRKPAQVKPLGERGWELLGPFGPKERAQPPGAPHRSLTVPVPASPQQGRDFQARKGLAPPRR